MIFKKKNFEIFINTVNTTFIKNRRVNNYSKRYSLVLQRLLGGFFELAFPYFAYIYVFHGQLSERFTVAAGSTNYIQFLIIGASMYIMSISTLMTVGRSLMLEIREGTLEPFLLSPASRLGYFFGILVEQIWRSSLELLIILFIGELLGASLSLWFIPLIILMSILVSISCFGMGILMSVIMVFFRDTFLTQNTVITIISILSGIYFPMAYLPKWLQFISELFPITWAVQIVRSLVFNTSSLKSLIQSVLTLTTLTIIYAILGLKVFAKMENSLVENVFS